MVGRTKENAQRTRSAILDAAEKVFHEKNAANAPLSLIAEVAGVTRGAIYWHFKNRCEILAAIRGRSVFPIEIITGSVQPSKNENPLEHLKNFLFRALCLIVRSPHRHTIFEMMLSEFRFFHGSKSTPAHRCDAISHMQVYIRACIELAVEQRQLSRHYDVAFAETVVSALLAGMLGDLMRSSQRAGLETAAKKAADLLVNALQLCPANPGPA